MGGSSVLPLEPGWQGAIQAIYDDCFAQADLPYGRRLPGDFLARRLFASCLWGTDCSQVVCSQEGAVLGFALANRRRNPAEERGAWVWLQLLCIAPRWQRQGLGRQLLHSLLQQAAAEGQQGLLTSLQWAGIWPGVPAGLTAMVAFCQGTNAILRPGECYLEQRLDHPWSLTCAIRQPTTQDGARLLPYADRHREGLQALLQSHFSIGWQHETLSRIDATFEPFNGYGLAHTRDPHQSGRGVLILEHAGGVVGFCVVHCTEAGSSAFFGPIGLHPAWRGQGWGSRMLLAAAQQAQQSGCTTLGLWTSAALAGGFYAPLGFKPAATTQHAEWRVDGWP